MPYCTAVRYSTVPYGAVPARYRFAIILTHTIYRICFDFGIITHDRTLRNGRYNTIRDGIRAFQKDPYSTTYWYGSGTVFVLGTVPYRALPLFPSAYASFIHVLHIYIGRTYE